MNDEEKRLLEIHCREMSGEEKRGLEMHCREMRKDCLRMAKAAGSEGFHFGAALSVIELVAVLYLRVMHIGK